MKITAKQYAQALLETLAGKNKEDAKKSIESLLGVMRENRDLKKFDDMIEHFSQAWDRKEGKVKVEVVTAAQIDKGVKSKIKKYIQDKLGIKGVEMEMVVDRSIKGGVVIRKEDKVYDGSLRTRLYELKKSLNK